MTKRPWVLGVGFLLATALIASSCGGATQATPAPTQPPAAAPTAPAPRPTQPPGAAPATAVPQPTPTPTPRPQSTPQAFVSLRIAASSHAAGWEPSIMNSQKSGSVAAPLFDWLVWSDERADLVPGIALRWELSSDGLSWAYDLRSMKFHNGQDLTAEDVKFSFERVVRQGADSSNFATWRASLGAVEVLGPRRVKVNTKAPWPLMSIDASIRSASEGIIIPKAYFEQVGEKGFLERPVGTGPWAFEREEVGLRVVFRPSAIEHPYRSRAPAQRMEWLVVPELSTRVAMLKTGAAEIIAISPTSVRDLRQANLGVLEITGSVDTGLVFFRIPPRDAATYPVSKLEVRRALAMAIDRKQLRDALLGGFGTIEARFLHVAGQIGYDPSWPSIPFDPAGARQLLAQAGYPNGFTIKFNMAVSANAPWADQATQAIAGFWAEIGVKTEIVPYEFAAFRDLYRQSPKPAPLLGAPYIQTAPVQANPLPFFRAINVSSLEINPELKGIIDEAIAATDPRRQVQLIREVSRLQFESYYSPSLLTTPELYGVSATIAGWTAAPGERVGKALDTIRLK